MPFDALPAELMPDVAMKRIHLHWTAGGYTASADDLKAYHFLIQGDGTVVPGNKSIAANAAGSGLPQASHTKGANTGAIGVSICCMRGAQERPFATGPSPMTAEQWNTAMRVVATLARRYGIPVTPVTILTHSEVEPNLNRPQNNKWDINNLSFDSSVTGPANVGNMMRRSVAKLMTEDGAVGPVTPPPDMKLPRFRVFNVAPDILVFRDGPGGAKKGELKEGTVVEFLAADGHWWRVRTPGGFVGWVFSSFLRRVG